MKLLLTLAFRNFLRNRTRTILNLAMIVGAFVAIVIFRGFAHSNTSSVETLLTEAQSGHIQIAHANTWSGDLLENTESAYIEDSDKIEKDIKTIPGVINVTVRTSAQILINNGTKSIGGIAIGYDPQKEPKFQKTLVMVEGLGFSANPGSEILIGKGIQDSLNLKVGDSVSIVSQSLKGAMTSVDADVKASVVTGFSELDNSMVFVPNLIAQKLLGTNRVERIIVFLDQDSDLKTTINSVKEKLKFNPNLLVKDWKEISLIYRQIEDFYGVQNLVLNIVLSFLVFLGILNTFGMSVFERIGEIGTLRALGDRDLFIFLQFIIEGLILAIIGSLIAAPSSYFLALGISALEIPLEIPGASSGVPFLIYPQGMDYFIAIVTAIMTCLLASIWPVYKALKISIVDALRTIY